MKEITELGISPAPWHVNQGQSSDDMWCEVRGKEVGDIVCDCMIGHGYEQIKANARFIESTPSLYEDLAEACREFCFRCKHKDDKDAADICDQCIVSGWKETLAAASGESEVAK